MHRSRRPIRNEKLEAFSKENWPSKGRAILDLITGPFIVVNPVLILHDILITVSEHISTLNLVGIIHAPSMSFGGGNLGYAAAFYCRVLSQHVFVFYGREVQKFREPRVQDVTATGNRRNEPGDFFTRPELTLVPLPTSLFAFFGDEPLEGDPVGVLGIVEVDPKEALGDCKFGVLGFLDVNFFFIWPKRVEAQCAFVYPASWATRSQSTCKCQFS
jgi:hypothetical protein